MTRIKHIYTQKIERNKMIGQSQSTIKLSVTKKKKKMKEQTILLKLLISGEKGYNQRS